MQGWGWWCNAGWAKLRASCGAVGSLGAMAQGMRALRRCCKVLRLSPCRSGLGTGSVESGLAPHLRLPRSAASGIPPGPRPTLALPWTTIALGRTTVRFGRTNIALGRTTIDGRQGGGRRRGTPSELGVRGGFVICGNFCGLIAT